MEEIRSENLAWDRLVEKKLPVLFVGEGKYSFSFAIALLRGGGSDIIASNLLSSSPRPSFNSLKRSQLQNLLGKRNCKHGLSVDVNAKVIMDIFDLSEDSFEIVDGLDATRLEDFFFCPTKSESRLKYVNSIYYQCPWRFSEEQQQLSTPRSATAVPTCPSSSSSSSSSSKSPLPASSFSSNIFTDSDPTSSIPPLPQPTPAPSALSTSTAQLLRDFMSSARRVQSCEGDCVFIGLISSSHYTTQYDVSGLISHASSLGYDCCTDQVIIDACHARGYLHHSDSGRTLDHRLKGLLYTLCFTLRLH